MHPHTRRAITAGCLVWGAVVAIGHYNYPTMGEPPEREARAEIGYLMQAVDSFWVMRQEYPVSLRQLSDPPAGMDPIMERLPADPWGNHYLYISDPGTLALYSTGRDGRDGTGDEICVVRLLAEEENRFRWPEARNCHCSRTDLCTAQ